MDKGIRVIWRTSAVVVLLMMVVAYMISVALRPEPIVGEGSSQKQERASKVNVLVP